MLHYFIRFFKYVVYYFIFLLAVLALVFYTTTNRGDLQYFWELIPPYNYWQVAIFLIVFAAVYPFFGFVKRNVYLNRPFQTDRDMLIECILLANYKLCSDDGSKMKFQQKSIFLRIMRLFEDTLTLDYSDNPIVLDGMRRDVYRFARNMEYVVRQLSREE